MPRWLRVLRGMVGTGLTFALSWGVFSSVMATIAWLIPGSNLTREVFIVIVGGSMWAGLIGVAFSGLLAVTARGRSLEKLSYWRFALLGAVGGLVLYGLLAANAYRAWSPSAALVNLTLFEIIGIGAATGTLFLARRARPELPRRDEPPALGNG